MKKKDKILLKTMLVYVLFGSLISFALKVDNHIKIEKANSTYELDLYNSDGQVYGEIERYRENNNVTFVGNEFKESPFQIGIDKLVVIGGILLVVTSNILNLFEEDEKNIV